MKMKAVVAAIALACVVAASRVSAQSAMFSYTGVPAGPVAPGSSFTIGINVVVTTGGIMNSIQGLSYWLAQSSPAGGPFPFAISSRDITGSLFTQTVPVVFPQVLNPISQNPNGTQILSDLGAASPTPLPSGTYFIANLTFSVAPNSVPGSYTIRNTTNTTPGVGGRISVFNDSEGDTFPIAASNFNITVVPEPGAFALLCVGVVIAGALAYRRHVAAR